MLKLRRGARQLALILLLPGIALAAPHDPAQSAYRLLSEGQTGPAIICFRAAIASETDPARLARLYADLGYVLLGEGEEEAARDALMRAVAGGHDEPRLLLEIAYSLRRAGEDKTAISWFERYIDEAPDPSPEDLLLARREVRMLENRLDGAISLFYRPDRGERSALTLGGRSLGGSQAIIDGRYRLIGSPERHVAPFARLLWAIEDGSPLPADDSLQAGIGLSVKPFARSTAYVAIERLVAVGRNSRSDWLARASWSAGRGFEPPLDQPRHWPYHSAFIDLALIGTDRPDFQIIGEARYGRGIDIGKSRHLTAFLFVSTLIEDTAPGRVGQYEGGPGLLLSLPFGGRYHAAHHRRLDLSLQYRRRIAGDSTTPGGITIQVALAF